MKPEVRSQKTEALSGICGLISSLQGGARRVICVSASLREHN